MAHSRSGPHDVIYNDKMRATPAVRHAFYRVIFLLHRIISHFSVASASPAILMMQQEKSVSKKTYSKKNASKGDRYGTGYI